MVFKTTDYVKTVYHIGDKEYDTVDRDYPYLGLTIASKEIVKNGTETEYIYSSMLNVDKDADSFEKTWAYKLLMDSKVPTGVVKKRRSGSFVEEYKLILYNLESTYLAPALSHTINNIPNKSYMATVAVSFLFEEEYVAATPIKICTDDMNYLMVMAEVADNLNYYLEDNFYKPLSPENFIANDNGILIYTCSKYTGEQRTFFYEWDNIEELISKAFDIKLIRLELVSEDSDGIEKVEVLADQK